MIDVWMGDDFFHNGAFRQTYGYDYALGLESARNDRSGLRQGSRRQAVDGFDYFLEARLVPLKT
jgi:hypothetical protein